LTERGGRTTNEKKKKSSSLLTKRSAEKKEETSHGLKEKRVGGHGRGKNDFRQGGSKVGGGKNTEHHTEKDSRRDIHRTNRRPL